MSFLCSVSEDVHKNGGEHGQDSRPKLSKGIFLASEHHAQYINEEGVGQEVPVAAGGQAGHRTVGSEELYCASLVSFGFYFSLLSLQLVVVSNYDYLLYFVSINKLFVSQPMRFAFSIHFFPHWGRGGGVSEQLLGLSCYLGLNHNSLFS